MLRIEIDPSKDQTITSSDDEQIVMENILNALLFNVREREDLDGWTYVADMDHEGESQILATAQIVTGHRAAHVNQCLVNAAFALESVLMISDISGPQRDAVRLAFDNIKLAQNTLSS